MEDYLEFARKLRQLAREWDDPHIFMPIVVLAEEYERRAEEIELQMIIEYQRQMIV